MRKALMFAFAMLCALPASAQDQGVNPAKECVVFPTSRDNPVIANKCNSAIFLELYDVAKKMVVEGEVKPNGSIAAPLEAFGAVCPAGLRSSVPVIVANRHIFAQDLYRCIRK